MEVTYPYLGHNLLQPTIWYFHFERTHISWVFGYRVIQGCKFCLSTLLIVAMGLVAFLINDYYLIIEIMLGFWKALKKNLEKMIVSYLILLEKKIKYN